MEKMEDNEFIYFKDFCDKAHTFALSVGALIEKRLSSKNRPKQKKISCLLLNLTWYAKR